MKFLLITNLYNQLNNSTAKVITYYPLNSNTTYKKKGIKRERKGERDKKKKIMKKLKNEDHQ